MIAAAVLLHRQMLDRLDAIAHEPAHPCSQRALLSVHAAIDHTDQLLQQQRVQGMGNAVAQVCFYKRIWPLFTVEREYWQRIYHARLFGCSFEEYYPWEAKRMERILMEPAHRLFIDYIGRGDTARDEEWFIGGAQAEGTSLCMTRWEIEGNCLSARGSWIAGYRAVERYRDWLLAAAAGGNQDQERH